MLSDGATVGAASAVTYAPAAGELGLTIAAGTVAGLALAFADPSAIGHCWLTPEKVATHAETPVTAGPFEVTVTESGDDTKGIWLSFRAPIQTAADGFALAAPAIPTVNSLLPYVAVTV